ncbi:hypothetical protein E3N88_27003 [Mikania micrantha]|uniref:Uncharacterized protein n=1 Tax=Mikania micrantha TaxID=192012 RepID=A0A5N6MYE8_9ASTR|nr:hypothetical protein E3N88_27003 [Mikania micrantha]
MRLLKVRNQKGDARTGFILSFHPIFIENPNIRIFQASLPRDWLDETAIFLYFRVDNVESFAWTPRTPKSVEKRVRYARLKGETVTIVFENYVINDEIICGRA